MKTFTGLTTAVMLRETRRLVERKTLYLLTIVLPLVLFAFLGLIYKNGVVRDIPIGIYDADNSELSRLVVRAVESTSAFRIVTTLGSTAEIEKAFRRGTINAAVYLPPDLERNVKSGKPGTIVIFNDATNLINANTTLKEASTVVRTVSAGILLKRMRAKGAGGDQAMARANPIRIETQALYNPTYNYFNFLLTGLMPVMLQMIIMVSAVLLINSEFTHNTFSELAVTAGRNVWAIILGKSIPHFALHMISALGILGIWYPLFGNAIQGSIGEVIILFIFFVAASFFTGLMISALFHDQQFATELVFFFTIPAFIFSGFIFPFWAMPDAHVWFGQLLPFTHFLSGFIKLYQMGLSLGEVVSEIFILLIFAIISLIVLAVALTLNLRQLPLLTDVSIDRTGRKG
jgi:ABC-2 type transport system permease protein